MRGTSSVASGASRWIPRDSHVPAQYVTAKEDVPSEFHVVCCACKGEISGGWIAEGEKEVRGKHIGMTLAAALGKGEKKCCGRCV